MPAGIFASCSRCVGRRQQNDLAHSAVLVRGTSSIEVPADRVPGRRMPLVAFPLTPKYMTLNDHFWHFTFDFQFSLLRTAFRRFGYILIIELFIDFCMTSPANMRESGQSIAEFAALRKNCVNVK